MPEMGTRDKLYFACLTFQRTPVGEPLPALSQGKVKLRDGKRSPIPDDQQGRHGIEVGEFVQLPMEEAGVGQEDTYYQALLSW